MEAALLGLSLHLNVFYLTFFWADTHKTSFAYDNVSSFLHDSTTTSESSDRVLSLPCPSTDSCFLALS
jgi:hypothetical protein